MRLESLSGHQALSTLRSQQLRAVRAATEVDPRVCFARDMESVTRSMMLRRLQELPIKIHTSTRLTRIEEGVAFVAAEASDEETSLGTFDSVLVAVGHRIHDPLSHALEAAGVVATVIGDAARPGQILNATRAGSAALMAETPNELP